MHVALTEYHENSQISWLVQVLYEGNESTTAEDSDNETVKITMTTTATSTATQAGDSDASH